MVPENLQTLSSDLLEDRLRTVQSEISLAARRAGRSPDEIMLVAVSKTHPAEAVQAAIDAGVTVFGENRVQEADEKIALLDARGIEWHLIGHLQSNKVRKAVNLFDVIQTIDSMDLAERVDRICDEEGKAVQRAMIQVKLGDEITKAGADAEELVRIAIASPRFKRLRFTGLMAIPPFTDNPEDARPHFSRLRELRDQLASQGQFGEEFRELSMGMSHDFAVAIEEGATIIRVGTAIFGERS